MYTMLLELYFNTLINKLESGQVEEVISDLKLGVEEIRKNENKTTSDT